MLKRLALATLFVCGLNAAALAQTTVGLCYWGIVSGVNKCTQVSTTNPLPVTATGSGIAATINGWAGGTLGAMASYGTSPGAVLVPGVNAYETGNANAIAQGATYSTQNFFPVMGLASTNAPTATNGDLWALSISPASGGLRIDLKDSAANTNPFNVGLNTTPTIANGNGVVPTQGGAVLSATNPSFAQVNGSYFYNVASSTLTRVANTTQYTANTTVCAAASVTACAPLTIAIANTNTGKGIINRVSLLKSSNTTASATFTIWLFSAAPGVATPAQYDDVSYTGPRAADMPNYIGSATCNSPVLTSDTSAQVWYDCVLSNPNTGGALDFQALSGSTNIDALISVTAAYTPASAETFNVYVSGVY